MIRVSKEQAKNTLLTLSPPRKIIAPSQGGFGGNWGYGLGALQIKLFGVIMLVAHQEAQMP